LTAKSNEDTLEELKVEPVDKKLRRYKSNWLRHETRMSSSMMPKRMLNCRPNGRRQLMTDDDTANYRGGWVGPRAPVDVKVKINPAPLGDIILVASH
jgi:hypothetical protein